MSTVTSSSPPGAHFFVALGLLPVWLLQVPVASEAAPGFRAEAGFLGGVVQPDPQFGDYQWDATARPTFAFEAMAGAGILSGGVRFSSWSTTQESAGSDVRVDAIELRTKVRAFQAGRLACLGLLGAGRVRVGYSPDSVTLPGAGTIALDPLYAFTASLGLALEHPLSRRFVAGAEIEGSTFSLDAAHREGDAVIVQSTSFESLLVRLRLSYALWSS